MEKIKSKRGEGVLSSGLNAGNATSMVPFPSQHGSRSKPPICTFKVYISRGLLIRRRPLRLHAKVRRRQQTSNFRTEKKSGYPNPCCTFLADERLAAKLEGFWKRPPSTFHQPPRGAGCLRFTKVLFTSEILPSASCSGVRHSHLW